MGSKSYFDDVAGQWDQMRTGFFPDATRERAFAAAQVQPGQLAADVGAGTGFISQGLLQRGLRVIAVDQSQAMLDEMQRKFGDNENITYRTGDADQLPIPDASVDYVFANMLLHHVETPATAIREMSRILRSGGKLVITDLDEHEFEFLRTEQHDRWLGFRREDIQHWLVEAGLSDVAVSSADTCCSADSTCGSETASVGIFVACGQK